MKTGINNDKIIATVAQIENYGDNITEIINTTT